MAKIYIITMQYLQPFSGLHWMAGTINPASKNQFIVDIERTRPYQQKNCYFFSTIF